MQVEISFPLWKALTNLLRDENDSYDGVISRLLGAKVPSDSDRAPVDTVWEGCDGGLSEGVGAYFKDVFLPEGTELRASYKGKTYFATISGSRWIDSETGLPRSSPSQAAYSITGSGVNGWLFWMVKRPSDNEWQSLNALRAG